MNIFFIKMSNYKYFGNYNNNGNFETDYFYICEAFIDNRNFYIYTSLKNYFVSYNDDEIIIYTKMYKLYIYKNSIEHLELMKRKTKKSVYSNIYYCFNDAFRRIKI